MTPAAHTPHAGRRSRRSRGVALAAVAALVFGVGATVGDIGSCGKAPSDLDPVVFARARKTVDCERCTQCGLTTARCADACDADAGANQTFPPHCEPLYQDGLVCLRALLSSSCGDYALYVADGAHLVPTECEFCRPDAGSSEAGP